MARNPVEEDLDPHVLEFPDKVVNETDRVSIDVLVSEGRGG